MYEELVGLKGEVFDLGGRVAGAIPPLGQKNAMPFQINHIHAATEQCPEWADMVVGKDILVRINPDICVYPHYRLFDMVRSVELLKDHLMARTDGAQVPIPLQGHTYLLWSTVIGKRRVIMVDTQRRSLSWNPNPAIN